MYLFEFVNSRYNDIDIDLDYDITYNYVYDKPIKLTTFSKQYLKELNFNCEKNEITFEDLKNDNRLKNITDFMIKIKEDFSIYRKK